jgi:lipopolysaccharide biosynthesis glycosyltransferase
MNGQGYTLCDMKTVYYVDAHYPHATVDSHGNWHADDEPDYLPIVGPRDCRRTAIVFSSDRRYFPGLMPALLSVRAHHPEVPLVIIDEGLTPQQVRYLQQYAEVFPSRNPLRDLPMWSCFDISFLKYDRVIYLDSDVIVLREIPALLETEAEFSAVRNLDWKIRENFKAAHLIEKYEVDPEGQAFNSGIFSLDNRIWGNGKLFQAAMYIYAEIGWSFVYADQSALQIIMNSNGHHVTFLEDEYNAIAECWDWEQHEDTVRIIHYAGDEIKPWHPSCKYPKLDKFFSYSKIRRV